MSAQYPFEFPESTRAIAANDLLNDQLSDWNLYPLAATETPRPWLNHYVEEVWLWQAEQFVTALHATAMQFDSESPPHTDELANLEALLCGLKRHVKDLSHASHFSWTTWREKSQKTDAADVE